MNDAVLVSDIKELLQAENVALADDAIFEGIQTVLSDVRGGELFIANSVEDANAALERGAATCLCQTKLEGCLFVSDLNTAIKKLAEFWRGRFDLPCILVRGNEAELVATVLARLLLKRGRGTYTANKLNDNYRAIFNLKNTSEWYIAADCGEQETAASNQQSEEFLKILKPTLIIDTDENTADNVIYFDREKQSICLGEKQLYTLEVLRYEALFGSTFSLKELENISFESGLIGKESPALLSLAVAATLTLYNDYSKEQLQSTIKRFNVLPGEMNLRMSCRGRYIIDGSRLSGEHAEKKLFELMAEVRNVSAEKCAIVIPAGYTERESFFKQLLEYAPSEVIAVGPVGSSSLKDSALHFFQTQSVNAALNLISKSDIRYLYILGGVYSNLHELTDKILEMEGETIPEKDGE